MEDFPISREELLSCWEKCDSTIWNIIRGSSPKYKVLCDAIQDCIRLKYGFNVYKTDLEAALDEMNERSYAGYRGIFGICPWETVALRPYTRRIQHAKEVSRHDLIIEGAVVDHGSGLKWGRYHRLVRR
jgi:hypothetical protein